MKKDPYLDDLEWYIAKIDTIEKSANSDQLRAKIEIGFCLRAIQIIFHNALIKNETQTLEAVLDYFQVGASGISLKERVALYKLLGAKGDK